MRIAKFVLCLSLLAAVAVGQTSSSSSNTSNQSANSSNAGLQTGDVNQAAQNPLGSANQTQTQNADKKPQSATFDVSNATAGEDQVVGEVRLMTGYSQLGGDPTRSFHTPGSNNLAEINYFEDHRFVMTQRLQVLSSLRATDDASIDPERDSLQKAYIRLYGPKDEVIVGDALVNYSRLSFNQNIKGLSTAFKIGDNWKISDVAGVFIDRWGSLYKTYEPNSPLAGRPYMAYIAGVRLERKLFKDSFLGFNFSSSIDQVDSLPFGPAGLAPEPARNRVGSIDNKLTFGRFRIDSEFAYSFTDFDVRTATCVPAPLGPTLCDSRTPDPFLGTQGDWGGRIEGSWRYKRLNLRESYVRYQPNFASVNARQISDLQDFSFRASYDLTDWLLADGTVRRSNTDLRKQLAYETTFWGPELHFVLHDLSFYKRGTLELGYRHRDVQSSEVNLAKCSPPNGTLTGCSVNQFVRIPYAELGIPVGTAVLTVGYERQNNIDSVNPVNSNNSNRFYAGVRGVFDLGGWHVNPNMRFELNREAHRPFINDTIPEFSLFDDSNRLSSVGLYVESPKWFIMELAYRSSSATIAGREILSSQGPNGNPVGILLPSGFSRPSYKAGLTYKYNNDENTKFIFAFERNNNFYFTSNNFDERIWSGTVVYRFGKRGQ